MSRLNVIKKLAVASAIVACLMGIHYASAQTALTVPLHQLRTKIDDNYRVIIDSDGVSAEADQIDQQLCEMFGHVGRQHRHRIVVFETLRRGSGTGEFTYLD